MVLENFWCEVITGDNKMFSLEYLLKSFYVTLLIFLVLATFSSVALADSSIMITGYEVSPSVLMPEDVGTITVTIKNSETEAADIRKVYLFSSEVKSLTKSYDHVGLLGPSQSMDLVFVFKAPKMEGIYFPELRAEVFNSTNVRYPIPINVDTRVSNAKEPAIEVEKIVPTYISPGDDFNIALKLTNRGESKADDINVNIVFSQPLSCQSPNNYYIKSLNPSESYELEFKATSDESAALGLYSIPIVLQYSGADTSKEQEEAVGIKIKGNAELSIASISSNPTKINQGDFVTLMVRIENAGADDAKSVKANIDLPFEGVTGVFLGKIGPEEDAPAVFTFSVEEGGVYEYNITVEYEDDFGNHTMNQRPELIVTTKENVSLNLLAIMTAVIIITPSSILFIHKKRK